MIVLPSRHFSENDARIRSSLLVQKKGLKEASINDIRKIFELFDPLPPCLHLELIYTIKFTQFPLLRPLFHGHPPPPMRTSYLDAPLLAKFTMKSGVCVTLLT